MRSALSLGSASLCLVAAVALVGCDGGTPQSAGGGGAGTTTDGGGGNGGAPSEGGGGAGGMAMGETVPDPGTVMGGEWTDVEPNDSASQAVPVGIMNGPVWMGFAEPYTAIGSNTDVDNFVFKSPDAATLPNVNIQICWSFPGNLLDLYLYEVVDSKKGMLVASATETAGACETVIDFGQGPTILQPDSVYLLEVTAGPGLDLAGDPGLYSA